MDSFLPGSQALISLLDHYILIQLRDGSTTRGILRSYDQFANLVLQNNSGFSVIRGENVVLLGESINQTEQESQPPVKPNELDIKKLAVKNRVLAELGFSIINELHDSY